MVGPSRHPNRRIRGFRPNTVVKWSTKVQAGIAGANASPMGYPQMRLNVIRLLSVSEFGPNVARTCEW